MTPTLIEFEVPLPPRELSSNGSHGHWWTTAPPRKHYRLEILAAHRDAFHMRPETPMARATLELVFCTKGSRKAHRYGPQDEANAVYAAKSLIDGLIDVGLIANDDHKHLTLDSCRIDNERGPFVRVRLEAL
jgi:hypothetical protein